MWFRSTCRARRASSPRPRYFRPRVLALEDRCLLNAGALDTSFGGTGVVTTSLSKGRDLARAVVIQPWDGKIVVAGSTVSGNSTVMALARYNADGSLDSTFGSGGTVASKIGTNFFYNSAALYPSTDTTGNAKKIVEAGGGAIARFNPNGSLDTSFGSRGSVTVPLSGDIIAAVVIQPDGKIVVDGDNGSVIALTRYNPNGTLDTAFGSGGTATLTLATSASSEALGLQADGKLVVAGAGTSSETSTWEVARFTAQGVLDTTFNAAGPVPGTVAITFAAGTGAVGGLAIYPGTGTDTADAAKIEVAGSINNQIALARLNPDGTPDSTFGQSGQVVTPSNGMAWATALQGDGKVVVAAQTTVGGNGQYSLLRYNTNGSLDTTFGNGGLVTTPEGTGGSKALGVAIQADGRIVTTGTVQNGGNDWNFMTARYLAGPEIGTFAASTSTVTSGSSLTLTASNLSDGDPFGSGYATITQVAFYALDQSGNQTLLGYGTYSNGAWTLNYTVSLASGSYTLFAQATDSDGIIGDSAFLSLTVQ